MSSEQNYALGSGEDPAFVSCAGLLQGAVVEEALEAEGLPAVAAGLVLLVGVEGVQQRPAVACSHNAMSPHTWTVQRADQLCRCL